MRQRLSERERREAILEAAFSVASKERLDAVTTRRVAEVAGVSAGLVSFHFESKDKLLLALCALVIDEVQAALTAPPSEHEPCARAQLVQFLFERVSNFEKPRVRERVELFFDFWVMSTRAPAIRRKLEQALASVKLGLAPIAQRVIDEDPARFAGLEAAKLSATIVALLHGAAIQRVVEGRDHDDRAVVDTLSALLGLTVDRARGAR